MTLREKLAAVLREEFRREESAMGSKLTLDALCAIVEAESNAARKDAIEECAAYADKFNPPAVGSWIRSLKKAGGR